MRARMCNLKDANGRMTYDTISLVDVRGTTDDDGDVAIAGIGSSNGDWPSGIWEDGLTAEEKRQRIKFGNFSISGIAVSDRSVNMTLDSIELEQGRVRVSGSAIDWDHAETLSDFLADEGYPNDFKREAHPDSDKTKFTIFTTE